MMTPIQRIQILKPAIKIQYFYKQHNKNKIIGKPQHKNQPSVSYIRKNT